MDESFEFIIPIRIDFKDREDNLKVVVEHIKSRYSGFVINVIECDTKSKLKQGIGFTKYFYKVQFDYFNRSYTINRLADFCKSKYICICDGDVIFDYDCFDQALHQIEKFDFVFPYTGPIYNINIQQYLQNDFNNADIYAVTSNSGVFLCNRQSFINAGLLNENFKGWGGEEEEFYFRVTKLGFKIKRISGPLYHLNHFRKDIFKNKKLIENNRRELEKIKCMNMFQLKKYYNISV